MPELDTVRGIAVFLVLLVHGFVFSYGYEGYSGVERLFMRATAFGKVGVNLFFVLSGFLITGILLNSRNDPHYFRNFYARRALRILPAYLMTLGWLLLVGASWKFVGLSVFFMANLTPLFGVAMFFGPLWSLAVEEHFYLIWPTLTKRVDLATVAAVAALIWLATPLLRWAFVGSPGLSQYTWFNCDGLALGALAQIWLMTFPGRGKVWCLAALCLFAPFLFAAAVGMAKVLDQSSPVGAALQMPLWNLLFLGVLLTFLLLGTSRHARWVTLRPLRFIGEISYGLYLIHLLVFVQVNRVLRLAFPRLAEPSPPVFMLIAAFICGSAVAILLAWISRTYFEERFLRLKSRFHASHEAKAGVI